jgi:hypothetical protein
MLGEESPYGAVCRVFNALAFQDENYVRSLSFKKENMIEVRVLCFIIAEYSQFLSSFSNRLLVRRKLPVARLNSNGIWSIEVNIVFFLARLPVKRFW